MLFTGLGRSKSKNFALCLRNVTRPISETLANFFLYEARNHAVNNISCYIVSVKVQFFCLPIGQNRITCRSTKRHVRQPVCNQTFIDRSIIKWMQYACMSTVKFQSSFNSFAVLKF